MDIINSAVTVITLYEEKAAIETSSEFTNFKKDVRVTRLQLALNVANASGGQQILDVLD